MRKLRQEVYESNAISRDQILNVVESVISDVLKDLDHDASYRCEKNGGVTELVHYYSGKGMSLRDVADRLGVDVDFDPLTKREE